MLGSSRCATCDEPGHIARNCPYRNKCFGCGGEGHLSRNCPQRDGYRDRDAAVDVPGPILAEAAASATGAAAAGPSVAVVASLGADTDSLDGVSVTSAAEMSASPGLDSQLDADVDSSDSDATPAVGSTPPPSSDLRDNQLDELASQPLLSSPASFGADVDSLYQLFPVRLSPPLPDLRPPPPPPPPPMRNPSRSSPLQRNR